MGANPLAEWRHNSHHPEYKWGKMDAYNVYQDCMHSNILTQLNETIKARKTNDATVNVHIIWAGNFNQHHPLWDEDRNHYLFMTVNLDEAQKLIDLTCEYELNQILPKGKPMLQSMSSGNWTRPDNIFVSDLLTQHLIRCNTLLNLQPVNSDHIPIITGLDFTHIDTEKEERQSYKKVNWEEFGKLLKNKLAAISPPEKIHSIMQANKLIDHIYRAIEEMQEDIVPKLTIKNNQKLS